MMGMPFVPFSNPNAHVPRVYPRFALNVRVYFEFLRSRTRDLDPDAPSSPVPPTHDQYYTIALTALYLYDYLLTFEDEVFSRLAIRAGPHFDRTVLIVGQVRVEGNEDMG